MSCMKDIYCGGTHAFAMLSIESIEQIFSMTEDVVLIRRATEELRYIGVVTPSQNAGFWTVIWEKSPWPEYCDRFVNLLMGGQSAKCCTWEERGSTCGMGCLFFPTAFTRPCSIRMTL